MKKKILDILTIALLVIVCTVMVFALVARIRGEHHPKIFGYGLGIVLSESMEPNLHKGSFIVIKEQDSYEVDDIITYNHKDGLSVTHRIKYIIDDEIIPKGDANDGIDDSITIDDVVGKVVFHCNAIYFIAVVALLALTLIVFAFVPEKKDNIKDKQVNKTPEKPTKPIEATKMEEKPVVKTIETTTTIKEPIVSNDVKPINTRTASRITWPNLDEIRSLEEIRKSKEIKPVPELNQVENKMVEPKPETQVTKKPQSNMWRDSFKVSDEDKTN